VYAPGPEEEEEEGYRIKNPRFEFQEDQEILSRTSKSALGRKQPRNQWALTLFSGGTAAGA
jgi:hypothetical protein